MARLENYEKPWMRAVLKAAAVYNIVWGLWTVFFPRAYFNFIGLEPPNYISLWQCIGMIVGVFGIGYAIAAFAPIRLWSLVFVGLLGKIFGPIGFLYATLTGELPLAFGQILILNDLIWWIPFYKILSASYAAYWSEDPAKISLEEALSEIHDQNGVSLLERSKSEPVLLVMLRHFGCVFCRESLHDLRRELPRVQGKSLSPILVHMSTEQEASAFLQEFGLSTMLRASDPERKVYRALGVKRGGLLEVVGPRVWYRTFVNIVFKGNRIGAPRGDVLQLPGLAAIFQGQVHYQYLPDSSDDRLPYASAECRI